MLVELQRMKQFNEDNVYEKTKIGTWRAVKS
jgi:hypothetical protein